MFHKVTLYVILIIFGTAVSEPRFCIPNNVDEIDLTPEGVLSWAASENCPITEYMVQMSVRGVIAYEYTVTELSLDVSFLSPCRSYLFTVTPVSDNMAGMSTYLESMISIPDDIDITILNFTESVIDDDLLLQWVIDSRYTSCVKVYHLFVWNEDSPNSQEFLLIGSSSYFLQAAPKCMKYQFGVKPYYLETSGSIVTYNYTVPPTANTPSLRYIKQDATTINTTWTLERFSVNRCQVTALHVNGTHFNTTIPIEDTRERPEIDVSVTGLRANSMYYFNVTVENEAGISRPYQLAVQTLPIDPGFEAVSD